MPLKEIMWSFHLSFDAHTSASQENASAGSIRVILKPYSDSDFGQHLGKSHGRVVGIKKKVLGPFCLAGEGRLL